MTTSNATGHDIYFLFEENDYMTANQIERCNRLIEEVFYSFRNEVNPTVVTAYIEGDHLVLYYYSGSEAWKNTYDSRTLEELSRRQLSG